MTLIGVWCDIITEQERNFKLSIRKPAFVERVYIYIIYSKRFMLYWADDGVFTSTIKL